MVEITKEIIEMVNKPGQVIGLGTTDKLGQLNITYFDSPQLFEDRWN